VGLFSPVHLVVLGVLALLLFGPNRLPEMGRQLGRGMRDFKEAIDGTGFKDALDGVNEVRTAVTPANLARAFVPGVSDTHEAFVTAKDAVSPTVLTPTALTTTPEKAPLVAPPAVSADEPVVAEIQDELETPSSEPLS
jgi:sec-independent protein translocase protein TatA